MVWTTLLFETSCLMLILLVQPGMSAQRHQVMKKLNSGMKPSTFVAEKLNSSKIQCAVKCLQDARCESFGSGPGGSCRVVDSVLTGPDLLPAAGWSYYGLSPPPPLSAQLTCSNPRLTFSDDAGSSAHSCEDLSPDNVPDNPLPVDQYGSQTIMIKKKHSGGDGLYANLYISLAGHLPPPPGASLLMSAILQGCYPRNTYSWNGANAGINFRLHENGGNSDLELRFSGWKKINDSQAITISHVFPNVDTYPTLDTVYFGPVLRPTVDVGSGDWQTCVTGFLVKYV